MQRDLVLSLFPGIDLLGRAFEAEGYCVVKGPDLLWGQSIEDFHGTPDRFAGVIGGSPCQDFSKIRRAPPSGNGVRMLGHFARVVIEARPDWFLLENVPGVPDLVAPGYAVQRFNLSARDCGLGQNRLRAFQFGSLAGVPLVIARGDTWRGPVAPCCLASDGKKCRRRTWADFCAAQGLPADFQLPGWSLSSKYRAVGNGVPIPMGRVVAAAIRTRAATAGVRVCACCCGRPVSGRQLCATAGCRKRLERRRRDSAAVTRPGPLTPAESQG